MTAKDSAPKVRRAVMWAVLILLAIAAAFYWNSQRGTPPTYREVTVTRGDLEVRILSTGVVQPKNRLEIKPPISGRADEVLVVEGQVVKKGQILAWMSSTERAALIDAARAKGPDEVKRWQDIYRATPVLAPINGTVILRSIEPGQTFTNNDAVLVMSDLLTVKAQVDETDIAQIRLRQPAHISLDAYPDQAFNGRVDQIAYDAKTVNSVTTYEVAILPDKTPAFMRSGMTANVSFVVAARREVLLAPSEALKSRDGGLYVLTPPVKSSAAPLEKPVKTGLSDGKHSEILQGLNAGDVLLVQRLRLGGNDDVSSPLMPFGRKKK